MDRLGDKGDCTSFQCRFDVLWETVRGYHYDWWTLGSDNRPRRFKPIHDRHLHIHQNHVERFFSRSLDRFSPIFDRHDFNAQWFEYHFDDPAIDRMIIGDQHF